MLPEKLYAPHLQILIIIKVKRKMVLHMTNFVLIFAFQIIIAEILNAPKMGIILLLATFTNFVLTIKLLRFYD